MFLHKILGQSFRTHHVFNISNFFNRDLDHRTHCPEPGTPHRCINTTLHRCINTTLQDTWPHRGTWLLPSGAQTLHYTWPQWATEAHPLRGILLRSIVPRWGPPPVVIATDTQAPRWASQAATTAVLFGTGLSVDTITTCNRIDFSFTLKDSPPSFDYGHSSKQTKN